MSGNMDKWIPGRELDVFIAEKIFGLEVGRYLRDNGETEYRCNYGWQSSVTFLPEFSTSLPAAWDVLNEMSRRGIPWCIERSPTAKTATVHISTRPDGISDKEEFIRFIEDMERISDSSESVAHAICVAAINVLQKNSGSED